MDIEQIKLALEQSRPDSDIERDEKRLPAEVLNFFGIEGSDFSSVTMRTITTCSIGALVVVAQCSTRSVSLVT